MHLPLCMNDITVFAPPCMTPKRAFEVYDTAFRRVVEYVTLARVPGDVLEFGTFRGYTARTLAALMKEWNNPSQLYLYDSWEGFPEMVGNDAECPEVKIHGTWKRGDCNPGIGSAGILIQNILRMLLPNRVHAIPGYYEKTVGASAQEGFDRPYRLRFIFFHAPCAERVDQERRVQRRHGGAVRRVQQ